MKKLLIILTLSLFGLPAFAGDCCPSTYNSGRYNDNDSNYSATGNYNTSAGQQAQDYQTQRLEQQHEEQRAYDNSSPYERATGSEYPSPLRY